MDPLRFYREAWAVDFEFTAPPGHRPAPLCLVARELRTGRVERVWLDGAAPPESPPYPTGPDVLFVSYLASADIGCHLALGWPVPERVLDPYAEFRWLLSGMDRPPCGFGLLGALAYFGLAGIAGADKEAMRGLATRGGPYTAEKRRALLDYCQTDVDALARLLPAMLPQIDLPRALLRGRYTAAVARMEWRGVPVDMDALGPLRANWEWVGVSAVRELNADYGIWAPAEPGDPYATPAFSHDRLAAYLGREGIAWPRSEVGTLLLDDDTLRDMAKAHPDRIGPIREALQLGELDPGELAVGPDGRNRVLVSPFASKIGRNQPSSTGFVFGPSCWLRSLIRPGPGRAVAYVDWSGQELGIAAALSGDRRMMEAYASGDPYLWFGKSARLVPPEATAATHRGERELCKQLMFGVLYGMGGDGLGRKLGLTPAHGRELLRLHQEAFPVFWAWRQSAQDAAVLTRRMGAAFGWRLLIDHNTRATSLQNFPMQGNGAEMMRLAACLATERGIGVCCPVHDAFLIEADADEIDADTVRIQEAMREASELVLPGFPLRTDAKVVRYPGRYSDPRGERMWQTVQRILAAA